MNTNGEVIKWLATIHNVSMDYLAGKLDVDLVELIKMRNNEIRTSLEMIGKISKFFNINDKQFCCLSLPEDSIKNVKIKQKLRTLKREIKNQIITKISSDDIIL